MKKNRGKPQIHVSGLEMLSKCGEQFRRRYIEGEIIPPGVALVVGKSTHRSVARDLGNYIDKGELLSLEEIQDTARDALVSEWQTGIRLDLDEQRVGIKKCRAEAIDKTVRLSTLHHREKAPYLKPTHIERPWVIEIPGYPLDLAGTLDIQEGSLCIRDTKTASKSPNKNEADHSLQLTAYALAVSVIDGIIIDSVALDYLVDKKSPEPVTLISRRGREDFQVLLRRVERAIIAIEKGAFQPARESDWWCSPKYCGYYSTCEFVQQIKIFT